MTVRDIYIAQWDRLWLLHRDSATWIHLEEGWVGENAEVVQIVYRIDGVPGRHGLRRLHSVADPAEDLELYWEHQAYQDVWDVLEPHDIDDAIASGGIRWYGHVSKKDDLDARGTRFF